MIDKDSKVWECIVCGYKYIDKDKVERCPYCKRLDTLVYHKNLVVTK